MSLFNPTRRFFVLASLAAACTPEFASQEQYAEGDFTCRELAVAVADEGRADCCVAA